MGRSPSGSAAGRIVDFDRSAFESATKSNLRHDPNSPLTYTRPSSILGRLHAPSDFRSVRETELQPIFVSPYPRARTRLARHDQTRGRSRATHSSRRPLGLPTRVYRRRPARHCGVNWFAGLDILRPYYCNAFDDNRRTDEIRVARVSVRRNYIAADTQFEIRHWRYTRSNNNIRYACIYIYVCDNISGFDFQPSFSSRSLFRRVSIPPNRQHSALFVTILRRTWFVFAD